MRAIAVRNHFVFNLLLSRAIRRRLVATSAAGTITKTPNKRENTSISELIRVYEKSETLRSLYQVAPHLPFASNPRRVDGNWDVKLGDR